MANEGWMSDLHDADAIIISTHSQGSIVSTQLLNRLIQDNHITTTETFPSAIGMPETISRRKSKVERVVIRSGKIFIVVVTLYIKRCKDFWRL